MFGPNTKPTVTWWLTKPGFVLFLLSGLITYIPNWWPDLMRLTSMVGATGVEPVRCHHRGILSPLRLPIPPRPHIQGSPSSLITSVVSQLSDWICCKSLSLTYINIITYFFWNVKFFLERRQDLFFLSIGFNHFPISPYMVGRARIRTCVAFKRWIYSPLIAVKVFFLYLTYILYHNFL